MSKASQMAFVIPLADRHPADWREHYEVPLGRALALKPYNVVVRGSVGNTPVLVLTPKGGTCDYLASLKRDFNDIVRAVCTVSGTTDVPYLIRQVAARNREIVATWRSDE